MIAFTIAVRNLFRNKRRTLITLGAMSFAVCIMIVYTGLLEGFLKVFRENAVDMDLAKIQVHASGYRDDPSIYTRLDNSNELVKQFESHGFKASERFFGFALAATGNASAGVRLRGVDVIREPEVTRLYRHVQEGTWLLEDDDRGVVIGKKVARSLDVRIGDEVIILGQATDGSMANEIYHVKGILKTVSEEIDRAGFFMTARAYRDLMVYDWGAHEIAVNPPEGVELDDAVTLLQRLSPGCEVVSWRILAPALAQMMDSLDVSMFLLYIIAYAAIGLVVLNAMLMAVFERIRELGIMKAIGITPTQIGMMVLLEAVAQTFLATLAGLCIGLPISLYLQDHGINLMGRSNGMVISGIAMDPVWSSHVTVKSVVDPIAFMALIVMIAVIYPGLKAAMIRPLKAIYHR
jgi:ABC-type lipoprotein release transport system permease subunit